jgi:putative FmdB family regulatory protein
LLEYFLDKAASNPYDAQLHENSELTIMPIYEYQCRACGHRFERIQKFSDPALAECPDCGQAVERLVSAPSIQFKGSGWYITDYARKNSPPPSRDSSGTEEKKESKVSPSNNNTPDKSA